MNKRRQFHKFLIYSGIGLLIIILIIISLQFINYPRYYHYRSESSQDESKVTIRLFTSWGNMGIKAQTLKRVLNNFMKQNPNIIVQDESLTGEDFLFKLKTDFASGNDPDVFAMWPGANFWSLVNDQKVADLTEILNTDKDWYKGFDRSKWKDVTLNNRIYGIPLELVFEGLFLNTDLFDAYHVKIPENYSELKTAIQTFRQNNIIPIAYNSSSSGTLIYQNIAAMIGGISSIVKPFENDTIHPCYIKAAQSMRELYQLGAFPVDYYALDDQGRDSLFLQKKAAMIVQNSEFIAEIDNQPSLFNQTFGNPLNRDISVDIIPFPYFEDGEADATAFIYGLGAGTFFMSNSAGSNPLKKSAAIKLLQTLTTSETANLFAEHTYMWSAVKIAPPNVYYSGLMKKGSMLLDATRELIPPPEIYFDQSMWEDIIVKRFPYFLGSDMKPEELWQKRPKASSTTRPELRGDSSR